MFSLNNPPNQGMNDRFLHIVFDVNETALLHNALIHTKYEDSHFDNDDNFGNPSRIDFLRSTITDHKVSNIELLGQLQEIDEINDVLFTYVSSKQAKYLGEKASALEMAGRLLVIQIAARLCIVGGQNEIYQNIIKPIDPSNCMPIEWAAFESVYLKPDL